MTAEVKRRSARCPHARVWATTAMVIAVITTAPEGARAQSTVAQRYQQSYNLEAKGKYRAALRALKKIPTYQRKGYFYQARLAWLQYKAGIFRKSIAAYKRAAGLSSKALEPLLGLMLPQMALRRWLDAKTTAGKILSKAPNNYLARSRLAWCLYNLGRYRAAEKAYRRVLVLYPSKVNLRAGLGWSLLKQKRLRQASQVFRSVLRVYPKHRTARLGLKLAAGVSR